MPAIGFGLTFDSFLTGRRTQYRDRYVEEPLKKGAQREEALQTAQRQAEIKISQLQTDMCATADRLETATEDVNRCSAKIKEINTEIISSNYNPEKIAKKKPILGHFNRMHEEALQKQSEALKDLNEITYPNDVNIVKSGFSELFVDIIENYRDFLSALTPEQLAILVNL